MSVATVAPASAEVALAAFEAAVAQLQQLDWTGESRDAVLDALRRIETGTRALAAVDHALLAEVSARNIAVELGCPNAKVLLTQLLRIDPSTAKHRLRAARDLGPRLGLSGEPLPPIYPHVAAATAAGTISAAHAHEIVDSIDTLPADVQTARGSEIEQFLVTQAATFTPATLRTITRRLHDTYNQDGRLASDTDRARRRSVTAHQHPDGSVSGRYHTDAATGQALLAFWDATAAPTPGPHGEPDPRTTEQRRHDALRDALLTVLRTATLPTTGGITTTILLTMTPDQLAAASGHDVPLVSRLVPTGHGALMDLDAVRPLIGEAQIHPVLLGSLKRVEAYGDTHRIFTAGQRLAMTARDLGCSFPGCTVGPAWCEAHHIEPFVAAGRTTVENGTLLCGYHHRYHERLGYTCTMIDGVPHWIPPYWIDRDRQPIRNTAHLPGPEPPGG